MMERRARLSSHVRPQQKSMRTAQSNEYRGDDSMRAYILISGAVFGAVALVHAIRILLNWPAQVAAWVVPIWISWIAVFGAGALCVWAYRVVGERRG